MPYDAARRPLAHPWARMAAALRRTSCVLPSVAEPFAGGGREDVRLAGLRHDVQHIALHWYLASADSDDDVFLFTAELGRTVHVSIRAEFLDDIDHHCHASRLIACNPLAVTA